MSALRLELSDQEMARIYDGPESRFVFNRRTVLAVVAVGAVYAALGYFFANQRILLTPLIEETSDPIVVTPWRIPPPPEVVPDPRPVEPRPILREPVTTYPTEVEPIYTEPTDRPAPEVAGPVELPAPRPAPVETVPAAKAPTVVPTRPAIIQPDWERRPSSAEMTRYYPDRAQRMERQGTAILNCVVTATGALTGCAVIGETPTGFGFGGAALQMSPLFRMRPMTRDGFPVGGARVNVPVEFRLGG